MNVIEKAKQLVNVVAVGDVHSRFEHFINKLATYDISNSVIIICGDVGVGFKKHEDEIKIWKNLNKIAKRKNNIILGVRGNHDNPFYFNDKPGGKPFQMSNIKMLPDYFVFETYSETILVIGGSISIDRFYRKLNINYWVDEKPFYDEEKLNSIKKPTIVITHAAPSFCMPQSKEVLFDWEDRDPGLIKECDEERALFDKIYNQLKINDKLPKQWIYGHYHFSSKEVFDGVNFKMLDELEFYLL